MDGCTCEQQFVARLETHEDAPALRSDILDGLRLIEDHILPVQPMEGLFVGNCQLITGDDDVEGRVGRPRKLLLSEELADCLSLLESSPVGQSFQRWTELFNFLLPVEEG